MNAASLPISGWIAPATTATPSSECAISARLAGLIAPCSANRSIASTIATTTSARSPAASLAMITVVGAQNVSTLMPDRASNAGKICASNAPRTASAHIIVTVCTIGLLPLPRHGARSAAIHRDATKPCNGLRH